jgi:hypothetical protein
VNEVERERDTLADKLTYSGLAEELSPRQVTALGRAAREVASPPGDDDRLARIARAERNEHQEALAICR